MTGDQGLIISCIRYQNGEWRDIDDIVSFEERFDIRCQERFRSLWAHPVELERLALGHAKLEWCASDERPTLVNMNGREAVLELGTSKAEWGANDVPRAISGDEVMAAMRSFISEKGLWDGTGCFHRASVYDPARESFLCRAEDIGRHNCLDRLAGWAVSGSYDLSRFVLFVSARVTASLFKKAAACGFRLIVSRSAVTTAALDMAHTSGVTLFGFARERESRFTVFCDLKGRVVA